jgi:hypothetical protein
MALFRFLKFKALLSTKIALLAAFIFASEAFLAKQATAYEESARLVLRLDANNVNLRSGRPPHRPFARLGAGTEIEIGFDPALMPQGRSPTRAELARIIRSLEAKRVPRRDAEGNITHFPAQGVLVRRLGEGSSANLPENITGYIALSSFLASGSLNPVYSLQPGQVGYSAIGAARPQAAARGSEPLPAPVVAIAPPAPPRPRQDFFSMASRALLGPSRQEILCEQVRSMNPSQLARFNDVLQAMRSQQVATRLGTQRFSQDPSVARMIAHARRYAYPSSEGSCLAAVREALHAGGLTRDRITYPFGSRENWAVNFGSQLAARGFRNLLADPQSANLIRSPADAPVGAVLVYEGTTARNHHGHTEIRTADGYVSDYFSRRSLAEGPGGQPTGFRLIGVYVPG